MSKTHLGIMVRYHSSYPPFTEKYFFKLITLYALKVGIDVTVFSPKTVLWGQKLVMGYRYHTKRHQWVKGYYPVPDVLYDRIQYSNRKQIPTYHAAIQRLQRQLGCRLLGKGLPGKWHVHNMLKNIDSITPFLPETVRYSDHYNLREQLQRYRCLFFKPASGSHGKGAFKLTSDEKGFHIHGRSSKNQVFYKNFSNLNTAKLWVSRFIRRRVYVVQPYLDLSSPDGHPFDIRILLQKGQKGQWVESGRAARVGKKDTLTSNIDGGGTAVDASRFLRQYYTTEQYEKINSDIETILTHLPPKLEERHGPLVELGVDIGVDRNGNVWIIELNSKPGRRSFHIAHNKRAFISAIITPVKYANHVVSKSGGR
ncbi:YheC/YheD family protein [Caldalkalibacillus salinus]|uniref:YheC/YheD family endospore coat-associated protein n=1 Tax=Caldalkalibacillus salinus TaxID=2803787 RepID=UPI001923FF15|nr:YheC/YheD family protein [Caldalkalibacillus salinus]